MTARCRVECRASHGEALLGCGLSERGDGAIAAWPNGVAWWQQRPTVGGRTREAALA
jgi:hypothetical protein